MSPDHRQTLSLALGILRDPSRLSCRRRQPPTPLNLQAPPKPQQGAATAATAYLPVAIQPFAIYLRYTNHELFSAPRSPHLHEKSLDDRKTPASTGCGQHALLFGRDGGRSADRSGHRQRQDIDRICTCAGVLLPLYCIVLL